MSKFAAVAMALLTLLAFSGGSVVAKQETTTIAMMEQNNSGQSGTTTFTLSDDQKSLTVEINISGGSSVPQPAHIHTGSCDNLDPNPFYPLNSVVNGRSVTVITEEDLVNIDYEVSNQFAVNVHKSEAEMSVYVSCGDIVPGGNVPSMPTTGSTHNLAPMLALVALGLVATGTALSFRRRMA